MEPLFHCISRKTRVIFLEYIISLIDEVLDCTQTDSDQVPFAQFLVENLLVIEYNDKELVDYLVELIDSVMRHTGVPLIHTFKSGLQERPVNVLARQCLLLSLLLKVKKHLLLKYGTSHARTTASLSSVINDWESVKFLEPELYEKLGVVIFPVILLIWT
jgi:hypothetical protein